MICNEVRMQYGDGILSRIGNTPLIRMDRIAPNLPEVRIYGKAEWFNPGGSVKDRSALGIVEDAIRSGALTKEKVLLDASSGNTGIAYSMICAVKGYRSSIVVPGNIGKEKLEPLVVSDQHKADTRSGHRVYCVRNNLQ